jgi:hemerythrin
VIEIHDPIVDLGGSMRRRPAGQRDVMNFLCNWLVGHIKGSDKQYSPFLNDRGIN